MNIIPAIDILDRKVVRLREGDYEQVTFYDTTLDEMLSQLDSPGTDFVHIIDLNGAKGDFSNQEYLVDMIKHSKNIKVQYGGGVRTIEKVKELIDLGFHRIIVGTQAITQPDFLEKLSKEICGKTKCSDQVVVAIDVLDEVIKYSGWMESSPIKLIDYVDRCLDLGFYRFLCTNIARDGKLDGVDASLYKKLKSHAPVIKIIASGGISSMKDIEELEKTKVESAVTGKAIYEGKISIQQVKDWNLKSLVSF